MGDHIEEPKSSKPPKKPVYVAGLVPSPGSNGTALIYIAALLVTDAVIEYDADDHSAKLTEHGQKLGLALVNPAHFTHTDIARMLATANATNGVDPTTGLNVTRIIDTNTPIHPISYKTARQQTASKHYL
jgi:hypothetical protein